MPGTSFSHYKIQTNSASWPGKKRGGGGPTGIADLSKTGDSRSSYSTRSGRQPQYEIRTLTCPLTRTGRVLRSRNGRTRACARRAGLSRTSRKRALGKAFGGFFLAVAFGSKFSLRIETSRGLLKYFSVTWWLGSSEGLGQVVL